MSTAKQAVWLEAGYALFARQGPAALKIEALARRVGLSKSSFYHFFADLEGFTEQLLQMHLARAAALAERERTCRNVVPELLHVLLDSRLDLLFHRQLRVHRQVPAYHRCYEQAGALVGGAFMQVWADMLGLAGNPRLAQSVLAHHLDDFYMRLTEENLTYEWLARYMQDLRRLVSSLRHDAAIGR